MEKYLLTDSLLVYMKEKFLLELNSNYFENFEKSIKTGESIIVCETMRNLANVLQDEGSVDYYKKIFNSVNIPDNDILKNLKLVLKSKNSTGYLKEEIRYGRPTPVPFIIATALHKKIPIIVDTTANDYELIKKISEEHGIEIINISKYLMSIS